MSRPPWARELKLAVNQLAFLFRLSRPPWARELKQPITHTVKDIAGRAPRGRVN